MKPRQAPAAGARRRADTARALAKKLRVGFSPGEHATRVWRVVYPHILARLRPELAGKPMRDWQVLDIGCGYHYPLVALFSSEVGRIEGVDIDPVFYRDGWWATLRCRTASSGLLRGLKWAGPRRQFYRKYYRTLTKESGRTFDHRSLSLSHYDGLHLPFPDASFDAVCSHVVLEHVQDIPAFVREVTRVLREDGVADMVWHNYYSPTGGHRSSDEVARSPWGHVTGVSRAGADLNRKLPDQMAAAFAQSLDLLRVAPLDSGYRLPEDPGYAPVGAGILDDSWRSQLAGYPEELLTTTCYLIQARKHDGHR